MLTSDQPVFLQVIFIDTDGGFRKLATLLEQALDVLTDEVRFKVDRITLPLQAERRHLRRVRNDGDAKLILMADPICFCGGPQMLKRFAISSAKFWK